MYACKELGTENADDSSLDSLHDSCDSLPPTPLETTLRLDGSVEKIGAEVTAETERRRAISLGHNAIIGLKLIYYRYLVNMETKCVMALTLCSRYNANICTTVRYEVLLQ